MSSTRPIANSTMPFLLLVVVILSIWRTVSAEDDTACLRKFKDSLKSSLGRFRNWNFGNFTPGSVCNFEGVQCWNQNENKVISLKLPNAGLMGLFPEGLDACSSLQALDLSGNNLSGLLPDGLCASQGGKYLTDLDLSSNTFSGPIPPSIGSCLYLHSLNLHGNRFQGLIPPQLGSLPRLGTLDLSNNLLSGEIPPLLANQSLEGFAGNTKLCGSPLPSCSSKGGIGTGAIAGIAAGAVVFVLVAVVVLALVGLRVWGREERRRKRAEMMRDEFRWVVRIEAPKSTPVSMFNKPLKPIYLSDLIAATNGFGKDNLVGRGRTGLVYKATLLDGSSLAIQRLPTLPTCAALAPKDFEAEMNALGQLRHPNLVPLLGYCLVGQERLLVYKHVTGGSLAGRLHKTPLEWPMRLKIGIGAARGLAWLHFSCNPRVLHGHMSSKSVMLDEEDDARITGFGLFRLFDGDFGDLGYYSPPEYTPWNLSASTKGDVYSFGVVLLELVIGKKAAEFCSNPPHFNGTLAEWIAYLSSSGGEGGGGGGMHEALDPSLKGSVDNEELVHFLRIACSCVASAPNERPSMYEVHQLLRSMGLKYDLSDENDEIPMTDACE